MKRLYFEKRDVFCIILFFVAIYICLYNGVCLYKIRNAKTINFDSIQQGDYVVVEISHYIVEKEDANSSVFTGQSETISTFFREYAVYNVFVDCQYVRLQVFKKDVLDSLEEYKNGHGKSIMVTGIVVRDELKDYDWYKTSSNHALINNEYLIRQVDEQDYINMIRLGSIVIIIVFLYFVFGLFKYYL